MVLINIFRQTGPLNVENLQHRTSRTCNVSHLTSRPYVERKETFCVENVISLDRDVRMFVGTNKRNAFAKILAEILKLFLIKFRASS